MSFERIVLPRPGRSLAALLLPTCLPGGPAGSLHIVTPAGESIALGRAGSGIAAAVHIHRWRALRKLLTGGEIGFAESYIDGDWSSPDLTALLSWAFDNEASLARLTGGNALGRLAGRLRHARNGNTRRGSRRNIAAHYDLGNAFYTQWLDAGMQYSSALYTRPDQTLEQAQNVKLDRIVATLELVGGESILEIGCGWGAVLERLAAHHRCTGITLSREQHDHARTRLARAGLSADVRLQDYRDLTGRYDRIVSIEMVEAVGERYWPVYFRKLRDCLAPGGVAVVQAITIAEERFANYRRNPDFIQQFVFPGGMLPTKSAVQREAARAGLKPAETFSFGASYARTLQDWRHRFRAAWPDIVPLGFDGRFCRTWEYYLAYCETGFVRGALDVSLFTLRG